MKRAMTVGKMDLTDEMTAAVKDKTLAVMLNMLMVVLMVASRV